MNFPVTFYRCMFVLAYRTSESLYETNNGLEMGRGDQPMTEERCTKTSTDESACVGLDYLVMVHKLPPGDVWKP